jgi:hypothetical protein
LKNSFYKILIALTMATAGCAHQGGGAVPDAVLLPDPIRVETAELRVSLIAVLVAGQAGTLVEDPGWREFIFDIENLSGSVLTVRTVKMLNTDGRFFSSAASYGQITKPPDVGEQVAGSVARSAAGIAAGQIVPFGSLITTAFFSAMSAMDVEGDTNSRQAFYLRVLKNVELAPGGRVRASAFLPGITKVKALVLEYVQENKFGRIEFPPVPTAP